MATDLGISLDSSLATFWRRAQATLRRGFDSRLAGTVYLHLGERLFRKSHCFCKAQHHFSINAHASVFRDFGVVLPYFGREVSLRAVFPILVSWHRPMPD